MAKATFANSRIAIAKESSEGDDPGDPNYTFLRLTSEALAHDIETTESQEIRPGRHPVGAIQTNKTGRGPINHEFPPVDLDEVIEGAMQDTWGATGVDAGTLTGTFSVTISSGAVGTGTVGATALFTTAVVGQWFYMVGNASAANDGWHRILVRTSADLADCEGPRTYADEGPTASVECRGTGIRIGTTKNTYHIIKQFTDPTTEVHSVFPGSLVNTFSFTARPRAIVQSVFDFITQFPITGTPGVTTGVPSLSSIANAGVVRPAQAIDNVLNIMEGATTPYQALSGMKLTGITLNLNNNAVDLPEIGSAQGEVALGAVSLNGTLEVYLEDKELAEALEGAEESALAFALEWADSAGALTHGYMITVPALDWTTYGAPIEGRSGAVVQTVGFAAKPAVIDGNDVSFQVDRVVI